MATTPAVQTGWNTRAEMARKGITQAELATAIGLSQPVISSRLRGKTTFDINEIAAVAAFLGVPLTQLLPVSMSAA